MSIVKHAIRPQHAEHTLTGPVKSIHRRSMFGDASLHARVELSCCELSRMSILSFALWRTHIHLKWIEQAHTHAEALPHPPLHNTHTDTYTHKLPGSHKHTVAHKRNIIKYTHAHIELSCLLLVKTFE